MGRVGTPPEAEGGRGTDRRSGRHAGTPRGPVGVGRPAGAAAGGRPRTQGKAARPGITRKGGGRRPAGLPRLPLPTPRRLRPGPPRPAPPGGWPSLRTLSATCGSPPASNLAAKGRLALLLARSNPAGPPPPPSEVAGSGRPCLERQGAIAWLAAAPPGRRWVLRSSGAGRGLTRGFAGLCPAWPPRL